MPIVVAVSFFILMYILTQQGEKMAKEERELKELEGCTFAPVMYTKKRKPK